MNEMELSVPQNENKHTQHIVNYKKVQQYNTIHKLPIENKR